MQLGLLSLWVDVGQVGEAWNSSRGAGREEDVGCISTTNAPFPSTHWAHQWGRQVRSQGGSGWAGHKHVGEGQGDGVGGCRGSGQGVPGGGSMLGGNGEATTEKLTRCCSAAVATATRARGYRVGRELEKQCRLGGLQQGLSPQRWALRPAPVGCAGAGWDGCHPLQGCEIKPIPLQSWTKQ